MGSPRIGFTRPVTGTFGVLAANQQRGAAVAIEELNVKGGILGRNVGVSLRDNQLKAAEGAQRTQELIDPDRQGPRARQDQGDWGLPEIVTRIPASEELHRHLGREGPGLS